MSKWIEWKYQLLEVRGGVVYPVALILLAIILAGSAELVTGSIWQYILFGLSALTVVLVLYVIYEILLIVHDVAMMPVDQLEETMETFEPYS
ncbi:hypothetical protein ES703_116069 [subsurface metagenome]